MKILPGKVKERLIMQKQTSCIVKCHDVVLICTGNGFPYDLMNLSKDPFTTTECVKDDNGHYILVNTKVLEGDYYKIFKETKKGTCVTLIHQN